MSRVAKKADFMTISIYVVLAAFVIYFAAALGACFDLSLDANGKADFDKLANSLEATLIKFNGGDEYIDLTLMDKYLNTAEIIIDNVKEGDFIYCVAVPLDTKVNVLKMTDVLFVSEADMLPSADALWSPIKSDESGIDVSEDRK